MEYKITPYKEVIKGNDIFRTFESISKKIKIKIYCKECGKKLYRSNTFTNTVNPFNKNECGIVKTSKEVMLDLDNKCQNWNPEVKSCEDHL